MKLFKNTVLLLSLVFISACGTTDSALREQGKSTVYIRAFNEGRHSGMREKGNYFENIKKDPELFSKNKEYRAGWLAGENEGKTLQGRANWIDTSSSSSYSSKTESGDDMAKEALKGADTSGLEHFGE